MGEQAKQPDMRDAFFDSVYQAARHDKNIIFMTADHGAHSLDIYRQEIPEQYYNIGIAEQNLVSVAAGLAHSGYHVFIYSITPFITLRCLEQIQIDVAAMQLPVTIVGVGAGFTYATDGPTHHGLNDLSVMASMPNMKVYSCSCPTLSQGLAQYAIQLKKPSYMRIEKGAFPLLYQQAPDFKQGFAELRQGQQIALVSHGYMTQKALQIADELATQCSVGVIDIYGNNCFDQSGLLKTLNKYSAVISIEEQWSNLGMGSILASMLMEQGCYKPFKRYAVNNEFIFKYGARDDLLAHVGLDKQTLVEDVLAWSVQHELC